jgi:hypothetical protein
MKTVFKEGDKVFHINCGWGIIDKINDYIIDVKFPVINVTGFNNDSLLSFTEYTLEGFSQERPIILPEVGELCLVRDTDSENWMAVVFSRYNPNQGHPFQSKGGSIWKQMKRIKILD